MNEKTMSPINFHIESGLYEEAKEQAKKEDRSFASWARTAIRAYLKERKHKDN
ncbi:MAG: hypothetical protein ACYSTI_10085 [Planctomycetota bacterium]|jgi:hypothetical protein